MPGTTLLSVYMRKKIDPFARFHINGALVIFMSHHALVVERGLTLNNATNKFVTTVAKFIQQRVNYVSS